MAQPNMHTLAQLKASNYKSKSIKEEVRDNLIASLKKKNSTFKGVHGYENTVVPDVERALLSKHNILLLGLRGQAKTKIARQITTLLDEWVPVVTGSPLNDCPLNPVSNYAIQLIKELGDDTPITWWHRDERFGEKLATPDVSVADLIGDIDPIKAANLKLSLSDEKVLHYGIIPRSNRAIFVINELPDLQARIQVSLFNILQEGDIQIRGFKLRMALDILFVFTANPEDYTNRGSIVTPLKDRIESQILTHYPKEASVGMAITKQEALINKDQDKKIEVPYLLHQLIEEVAIQARISEFVDRKSGVSARLTIAALENLYASAERRIIINSEKNTTVRISDLYGTLQAITGKIELVYEGEQEGSGQVAIHLIGKAIRSIFAQYFPDPEQFKRAKQKKENPYTAIISWFAMNNKLEIMSEATAQEYQAGLHAVSGLRDIVKQYIKTNLTADEELLWMEFALHSLSEYSLISKKVNNGTSGFSDILGSLMDMNYSDDEMDI
jgi:magnesium chelatase subunit I